MRIVVQVKTRARQTLLKKISEGVFRAYVTAAPEKGKANEAVCELIADYFEVSKSAVRIVIGKTAREKLVEVDTV